MQRRRAARCYCSGAMAGHSFTKNYRDHSSTHGFQFEFFCDKCGSGRRSSFKTNPIGVAASVLRAAGAFFGGRLRQAGMGAHHLKDALRGSAWDDAFAAASSECRPAFRQCTVCGKWVCPEVCWNDERGLCETCAPDLREHAPALQAQAALQQAKKRIHDADQVRDGDVVEPARAVATCTKCQATLAPAARFCAECGAAAPARSRFCEACGNGLLPSAKFCSGCGAGVSTA